MLTGLNHITIAVSDLDISLKFYEEVIGCVPEVHWTHGAFYDWAICGCVYRAMRLRLAKIIPI